MDVSIKEIILLGNALHNLWMNYYFYHTGIDVNTQKKKKKMIKALRKRRLELPSLLGVDLNGGSPSP